ncbi:MAG: hypothetical protein Q4B94_05505 [Pseudomonadota bacterium]|nr:hypothetical protein [Pseudomonadota bacterium]
MSDKVVNRWIDCVRCEGSGEMEVQEYGEWVNSYSSASDRSDFDLVTVYRECEDCNGRKGAFHTLLMSNEICSQELEVLSSVKVGGLFKKNAYVRVLGFCNGGKIINKRPYYAYATDWLGRNIREYVERSEHGDCKKCFGTGFRHYVAREMFCLNCRNGWVEEVDYKWEKSFFGGEVERKYISKHKCSHCHGDYRFGWVRVKLF